MTFTLTNPVTAQGSPAVTVLAAGTTSINEVEMDKPNTALLGVPNGANPLLVVRTIGQSTPVAGAANMLTVTLSGLARAVDDVITIKLLTGAVAQTGAITLSGADATKFSGVWDNGEKSCPKPE